MSEVQKTILRQNRVPSSLYIQNIAALNHSIQTSNEGIKHGSYDRYLLKKKGILYSKQGTNAATTPLKGNKTQSFSLTSKMNSSKCTFCHNDVIGNSNSLTESILDDFVSDTEEIVEEVETVLNYNY
tara:strand:+ start:3359 stop:3739 length:381 start_codon:yes stop_codon:yes gene_type:complete